MSKMDYANEVAKNLGASVVEVPKNNVVLTGVVVRQDNIGITCYIDTFYDKGLSVSEATEKIKESVEANRGNAKEYNSFIQSFIDFENVKNNLTIRMYNKSFDAEVFAPADKYGFNDLILVPYVKVPNGSIKVLNNHLQAWGVDSEEVIRIAIENTNKDIEVSTMDSFCPFPTNDDNVPLVISNKSYYCGAGAILGYIQTLKEKFNHFYVLPSSIHEFIVVPALENIEYYKAMVREVNTMVLNTEDILSYSVYEF